MTTIAVTGHINLTAKTSALVRTAPDELLPRSAAGELVGVSCLAWGADCLFAEAVLALGGQLAAVIPSRDYRWTQVRPEHAPVFDRLVEAASRQAYEGGEQRSRRTRRPARRRLGRHSAHWQRRWYRRHRVRSSGGGRPRRRGVDRRGRALPPGAPRGRRRRLRGFRCLAIEGELLGGYGCSVG